MGGAPTKISAHDSEICIIGTGPVGLWTAYNILINDATAKVVIYDKKRGYDKSHILNIDKDELVSNIRKYRKTAGQAQEADGGVFMGMLRETGNIPVDKLVGELRRALERFEGRIQYKILNIGDPAALSEKYDMVIGADGVHSIIRKKIFCDAMSVRENLQKILMVRFLITNDIDPAENSETYIPKLMDIVKTKVIHDIRYGEADDNNDVPVTLTIVPDKDLQSRMKDEVGASPLHTDPWDVLSGSMDDELRNKVVKILSEKNIPIDQLKNLEVKCVELNNYAAAKFTTCINGTKWFLVGDAAAGVPFFRSLNKGFKEGLYLANEIRKFRLGQILNFDDYEEFMKTNSRWEINKARAKSLLTDTSRKYLTGAGDIRTLAHYYPIIFAVVILVAIIILIIVLVRWIDGSSHPIEPTPIEPPVSLQQL